MNDNDVYEMYKNYRITDVIWQDDLGGIVYLNFPPPDSREYFICFSITDSNVVLLDQQLPEFVMKDIIQYIRDDIQDGTNRYLWGV